jgi:hypothetical protein
MPMLVRSSLIEISDLRFWTAVMTTARYCAAAGHGEDPERVQENIRYPFVLCYPE